MTQLEGVLHRHGITIPQPEKEEVEGDASRDTLGPVENAPIAPAGPSTVPPTRRVRYEARNNVDSLAISSAQAEQLSANIFEQPHLHQNRFSLSVRPCQTLSGTLID